MNLGFLCLSCPIVEMTLLYCDIFSTKHTLTLLCDVYLQASLLPLTLGLTMQSRLPLDPDPASASSVLGTQAGTMC